MSRKTDKNPIVKDQCRPIYKDYLGEGEMDYVFAFIFLIGVLIFIYGFLFYYFPKQVSFVTIIVLFAIIANKYKDPVLTKKEILEQAGVKLDQEQE